MTNQNLDGIVIVNVVLVGTDVTINFLSLKSASTKFELVIDEKLSNNIISCADMLCEPEKVIVTSADPLVVVNALVRVFVDLIGCMS